METTQEGLLQRRVLILRARGCTDAFRGTLLGILFPLLIFTELACELRGLPLKKQERLTRIASEYAARQGYAAERYELLSIQSADGKYWILFHGKSGLPGDHFTVLIEMETEQPLKLMPGS